MTQPTIMNRGTKDIVHALMGPTPTDIVPWSYNDLRAILEHQLATPLMSELDELVETSRISRDQVLAILDGCGCKTFLDVIRQASQHADAIRLIKQIAKASLASDGDLPQDVARVIYILAIVQGQQAGLSDLTSLDSANLERETRRCLTFGWLPDEVRALLRA